MPVACTRTQYRLGEPLTVSVTQLAPGSVKVIFPSLVQPAVSSKFGVNCVHVPDPAEYSQTSPLTLGVFAKSKFVIVYLLVCPQ